MRVKDLFKHVKLALEDLNLFFKLHFFSLLVQTRNLCRSLIEKQLSRTLGKFIVLTQHDKLAATLTFLFLANLAHLGHISRYLRHLGVAAAKLRLMIICLRV